MPIFVVLAGRQMLVVGLMRAVTFHGHHIENDTVVNHAVDSSHYVG